MSVDSATQLVYGCRTISEKDGDDWVQLTYEEAKVRHPDMIRERRTLARRIAAEVNSWRPITTAPKDGTPILATNAGYAYKLGRCCVVFWQDADEEGPAGWYTPEDTEPRPWLTHWLPLPPPPVVKDAAHNI